MRRALHVEQRLDLAGHVATAIAEVRAVVSAAPDVGAILIAAYRVMSALAELREIVDALPIVERDK